MTSEPAVMSTTLSANIAQIIFVDNVFIMNSCYTFAKEATMILPFANKDTLNITTAKIIFDVDLLIFKSFFTFLIVEF